ncbi:MAG: DUF362 domain-containing protein [Firmicutes bacterium]|nr:DUF362 domain-containing protein [Bacillota bacterium]
MIFVNYGLDWAKATYNLLVASDITDYLKLGMSVALKPNLVNVTHPSEGATTHPEVLEGIIQFLQEFGIKKIKIMESGAIGNNTKKAYKVAGYEYLTQKYGVPLVDLKNAPTKTLQHSGLNIPIAEEALNAEFLIDVPVLKAHCQTKLTCCLKNLKGCLPESEMRRFHTLGLHKPIAALAALLPVHYCVVDGICGDLSFEEGGTPVEANRIIAARNPLLVDSFCAGLIGYQPEEIGYLSLAKEHGIGEFFSENTQVVQLNTTDKPQQKSERISERYRKSNIVEKDACSVCYSALVFALHRAGGTNKNICIGQAFKGEKNSNALGIGNCTANFDNFVKGCPPKAVDILEYIKK